MKFLRLTVAIFLSITLPFTPLADAKECEKSAAHPFLLCGNWSEPEIDELLSSFFERTDGMLVVGPETWEWTP